MTDDVNEAEEMRIQTLASDCVAEIGILNEAGSVAMRGECGKRLRWKYRARTMQRSLTDAAQQLLCNQQVIVRIRLPALRVTPLQSMTFVLVFLFVGRKEISH